MKNFKKVLSLALALLMVVGGLVVAPVNANADTATADHVVIHEVYGGGGNSGAVYTSDYIVLYNPTESEVSLDGWSVQYTSKAGDFSIEDATKYTVLSGSIGAGEYYLIKEADGSNSIKALPVTADVIGEITMGAKAGKVALVKNCEAITGKDDADVVDFVAFGSGCDEYEGTGSTAATSNSTSAQRTTLGVDTDDNSADFTVVTPDLSYLVTVEYYLIGYINGANYGCEGDWENLGEYKFVGGELTAQFEQDSYVFVKTGDNANWYMCQTYVDGDEATLYNTSTGTSEKMKVPGGVKYDFTLVENADGSLTLTYEPAFVAPTEAEDIVNALYALEEGATLPEGPYTLTGTITSVDTAYDLGYENVTVTMVVGDMEDKPVTCYRLKGTGADVIGVGDEITVTGNLKNHYGTYEFTSGCTLDSYVDNPDPTPADLVVPEDATEVEIIELANTLVPGQSLVGDQTVTGVITEINTPYDEGYKNITVTIQVGDSADTQILVFRMKGEGAADLAVGDKITVTGKITNYKGTVEFDAGTTFVMADGGQQEEIPNKGDNFLPIAIVLFAGVALVAVGVVGKKKFA